MVFSGTVFSGTVFSGTVFSGTVFSGGPHILTNRQTSVNNRPGDDADGGVEVGRLFY
jgi:hypothetical protein